LLISRYKFSRSVEHRTKKAKQRKLTKLDRLANDDTVLDWVDIGFIPVDYHKDGTSRDHQPSQTQMSTEVDPGIEKSDCGAVEPKFLFANNSINSMENESSNISSDEAEIIPQVTYANKGTIRNKDNSENSNISSDESRFSEAEIIPQVTYANKGTIRNKDNSGDCPSPSLPKVSHRTLKSSEIEAKDNESIAQDTVWTNHSNAWCACVCGKKHKSDVDCFGLQCDWCKSWYEVASKCVGFEIKKAKKLDKWICWGCPSTSNQHEPTRTKDEKNMISPFNAGDLTASKNIQSEDSQTQGNSGLKRRRTSNKPIIDEIPIGIHSQAEEVTVLTIGQMVAVEEHGWARVATPSGVGWIRDTRIDEDGNRVYDIKYVVGRTYRNILAEFIRPHTFNS
jgi:hypothetical protein